MTDRFPCFCECRAEFTVTVHNCVCFYHLSEEVLIIYRIRSKCFYRYLTNLLKFVMECVYCLRSLTIKSSLKRIGFTTRIDLITWLWVIYTLWEHFYNFPSPNCQGFGLSKNWSCSKWHFWNILFFKLFFCHLNYLFTLFCLRICIFYLSTPKS